MCERLINFIINSKRDSLYVYENLIYAGKNMNLRKLFKDNSFDQIEKINIHLYPKIILKDTDEDDTEIFINSSFNYLT